MTLKKNLFAALVVGCALALSANTASAHLFGRGSHGSHGSYGGSWGGSYGSYGGSYGGSWGGSYGGSYGSYGSYGSGGSYGGYSVSYGSGGSWGGSSGSCGSCGSCGGSASYGSVDDGYASSRVTSSTVVASSAPAVKTSLTLHVPADAKVTLAGVDTKQSGEARQFATTRLAAGQKWEGYKVVVEVNKNGQTQREERMVNLVGGESQELSINFDSTAVAKN